MSAQSADFIQQVNGMSPEEYAYIVNMTTSSAVMFKAVSTVYNRCAELLELHPEFETLRIFESFAIPTLRDSKKLLMWSRSNLDMNRFPSSQSEVEDAWSLAHETRDNAMTLLRRYKWLMDEPNDNYISLNFQAEIELIVEKSVHLFGLLIRAKLAVSETDGIVNPVFLTYPEAA